AGLRGRRGRRGGLRLWRPCGQPTPLASLRVGRLASASLPGLRARYSLALGLPAFARQACAISTRLRLAERQTACLAARRPTCVGLLAPRIFAGERSPRAGRAGRRPDLAHRRPRAEPALLRRRHGLPRRLGVAERARRISPALATRHAPLSLG